MLGLGKLLQPRLPAHISRVRSLTRSTTPAQATPWTQEAGGDRSGVAGSRKGGRTRRMSEDERGTLGVLRKNR